MELAIFKYQVQTFDESGQMTATAYWFYDLYEAVEYALTKLKYAVKTVHVAKVKEGDETLYTFTRDNLGERNEKTDQ